MEYRLIKKYMRLALGAARNNLTTLAGGPFGACIVKGSSRIALARNTVLHHDATAHAEINAIRAASKALKTFDLSGCVIYSTTEPCPMCFGAIHWARIDAIIYGTTIHDAAQCGFNELALTNRHMKKLGKSSVKLYPHFLRDDCLKLFADWNKLENKLIY